MKWLRLYTSILHDPKVQGLPASSFKLWINLLAIACDQDAAGRLPSVHEIALFTRLRPTRVQRGIDLFTKCGLIDAKRGRLYIHNWSGRQYVSDDVSARVKRSRKRSRNVTVTPPEERRGDPPSLRSVGEEKRGEENGSAEPTMREPDTSPDPPADTDVASQSSPPTDRSPPPAVQDGDDGHPEGCTCERHFRATTRESYTAEYMVSEVTRHAIADLFAYPPAGKRMNALLSGQLGWAAGATEEHWQELLHRARNGKNQPDRQADGSIKEGWAKTTMRGILEGAKR